MYGRFSVQPRFYNASQRVYTVFQQATPLIMVFSGHRGLAVL
jgi:hypothetical protein